MKTAGRARGKGSFHIKQCSKGAQWIVRISPIKLCGADQAEARFLDQLSVGCEEFID